MIIDVSVKSIHASSNLRQTINADKYSSGSADHGAYLKDQKHAHYIHDVNAIGFTLDSMRGEGLSLMQPRTSLIKCMPRARALTIANGTQLA